MNRDPFAPSPNASKPLVAGLDGGGTKTLLAVADARGNVRELFRGAGVNPFDAPDWRNVLDGLAARVAPLAPSIAHAAFGQPGYGEAAAISAAQETAAAAFGIASRSVLNDVEAAFEGAFLGQSGVLLLAGAGAMAWARTAAGRNLRVGGWGDGFGDEGSAYWIGRTLLGRITQGLDGRLTGDERHAATDLAQALFRHLGLQALAPQEALLGWYAAQRHPRSGIAALSGFVDAEAGNGNALALALVRDAADHLALHAEAAWAGMANENASGAPVGSPWSYAGGVFRSPRMLDAVAARLETQPVPPALPPVGGALVRAAREAGWDVGEEWVATLRASLAERLETPASAGD